MTLGTIARHAVAALLVTAGNTQAATLRAIQGEVMVNHGQGYGTVKGETEVYPGDSVVVGPTGSAEIIYAEGCHVPVAVGAVAVVSAEPPCLTTGALNGPLSVSNSTLLTVGAVALGGAGLAAVLLHNRSASP